VILYLKHLHFNYAKKKEPFPPIFLDHFQTPVFKDKVNLVFCKDVYTAIVELEELEAFAKSFMDGNVVDTIDFLKDSNAGVFCYNNMNFIILPYNATRGVIAHEIFHLAVKILNRRGLKFSDDSEEAYAHLIDWLTEEIYSHHDSLKKKQAKYRKKNRKVSTN